jgi:hypothetical protein
LKLKILVLVALLVLSSAFVGGWKWKSARHAVSASPGATYVLADGYTADGWSWGGGYNAEGWSWGGEE